MSLTFRGHANLYKRVYELPAAVHTRIMGTILRKMCEVNDGVRASDGHTWPMR